MDNVFEFRDRLVAEYQSFSGSFVKISAQDIRHEVEKQYTDGRYWPEPLIQINPNYQRGGTVQDLVAQGTLHRACAEIFQSGKPEGRPRPLELYKHQLEALAKGQDRTSYVVTTGTGSGKSLSFFIPVIDRILRAKEKNSTPQTRAIVIYPMNALANSQLEELEKFLYGYPEGQQPFTVARYTGQESSFERKKIADNPPDILLTNFMMLELILTRFDEDDRRVVEHCSGLEFLVLDELHTYRGRQGADVALLVRRLRERLEAHDLVCIGTSATMSSVGSQADRNKTVAQVATKLFGTEITEHDIIGETLERVTDAARQLAEVKTELASSVRRNSFQWKDFSAFQRDPLAIWIELNLGIELVEGEPPRRAKPLAIKDASERLAKQAGCTIPEAKSCLQNFLVAARDVKTPQGRPPFAFKLHQFISGPGKVLTTLEALGDRYVTLDAQVFAPGRQEESVQLYPAHFCRDCGQEYHPVWKSNEAPIRFEPREIDDVTGEDDENSRFGFLCPIDLTQEYHYHGRLEDLPESWLDQSRAEVKVKSTYRDFVPYRVSVNAGGNEGSGEGYWYIPGKFRFCLHCGQVHEAYGKDINRLSSLSGEGRSSATTILTLSALRQLFAEPESLTGQPDPRKLLGFTDNRQDAALQAGHFNDFIFLLTLRAGLITALQSCNGVLDEERGAEAVFKALGFDKTDEDTLIEYLRTPKLMGLARQEAQRTLRFILGYRLIRDLRKGWRFNNPNLEQLELLSINYRGLKEFCADSSLFAGSVHVARLSPAEREQLCMGLFETMRFGLCLESRYLDPVEQDKAKTSAFTYLNERWTFSADEVLESGRYLVLSKPAENRGRARKDVISGGPRSRLLRQVRKAEYWSNHLSSAELQGMKESDWVGILGMVLNSASQYGYVQRHTLDPHTVGWRLNAAALEWRLTLEDTPTEPLKGNQFFRRLYQVSADLLKQQNHPLFEFEAQEHTAQVDPTRRQLLEQRFRFTEKDRREWAEDPAHDAPLERLPVMFCSPTMELGVDISALNTVYLRNVPPTPANYAQRSGRAGRSGQQALVITYCAAQSPHDQWFFRNATEMVHGVVKPPTLDLANRDLVQSHLHAVWLAAAQIELDPSIAPMLDLDKEEKPVKSEYLDKLSDSAALKRALKGATRVIDQLKVELDGSDWFSPEYVQKVIYDAPKTFSAALERWRALFDATRTQMKMADQVVQSHSASLAERSSAQRRYADAHRQYAVLLKNDNTQNSDFYTYRYLASQGFLPGYNFPRLPLMAWIPARGGAGAKGQDDDGSMVSRPRFLALSEFGPRSLIYHQGRMYRVVRAKLNIGAADHITGDSRLATVTSLVCSQCGYGHLGEPGGAEPIVNRCENCDALLSDHDWVRELYRIETVETIPVERISINDEDRQRQGFELQTTYRFLPGPDGKIQKRTSRVQSGNDIVAELTYSPSACLWRINRGWRRRKDRKQLGFYINPITGTWSKQGDPNATEDTEQEEAQNDRVPNQRIVPFVEDHRNLLILAPARKLDLTAMATLQAALKRGIEMTFQIEESELVAEPLPTIDERVAILFYEAAEGGAGVLTRIARDPGTLAEVASAALRVMHYKQPEGPWEYSRLNELERLDDAGNRICEAGCYQCLLSYFNQPDHENIKRRERVVLEMLVALANGQVEEYNKESHPQAGQPSSILSQWLEVITNHNLRKPDATQVPVNQNSAIAAAQYKAARALIFLEPVSNELRDTLTDKGWQVLDFSNSDQWMNLFAEHQEIFGLRSSDK